MRHPERVYFDELKKQIVIRFRERIPDCSSELSDWKGKVIEQFQDDLQEKVQGRISTRWFYDHLKSEKEDRIPRIDILNLLSEYCGFDSWEDLKEKKKEEGVVGESEATIEVDRRRKRPWGLTIALAVTLMLGAVVLIAFMKEEKVVYTIRFVDSDFGIPIVDKNLELTLLRDGKAVSTIPADSSGCVQLEVEQDDFQIVVQADYYRTDTIWIHTEGREGEEIEIQVDDYSLLIHQLSVTDGDDWERRRSQLDEMIDESVEIFLVAEYNQGIEMYNKEEFIDRMTMPIQALTNIRILQTDYNSNGKIIKMRITQEDEN